MRNFDFILRLLLFFVAVSLFSCIKEEPGNGCPTGTHYLVVRSLDANNGEITGTGAVKEVVLYMFDQNRNYFKTVICEESQQVSLTHPTQMDHITVVGWGNSAGGNQVMPQLAIGTPLAKALVTLKKNISENSLGFSISPDDLFYGTTDISFIRLNDNSDVVHDLFVKRKVASMSVVIGGLQQWYGTEDTDFTFLVHGTRESLDFNGSIAGNDTFYKPPVSMDANGWISSGIFNTFASGDAPVYIDIYKGTKKIYTVYADGHGVPLRLSEGLLLNVLIDFRGEIRVGFTITNWGEIDINQEF